jgi:hypothetical protein
MTSGTSPLRRRNFLGRTLGGLGGLALGSLAQDDGIAVPTVAAGRPPGPDFAPRAKRAIWLFMGGGPSQLETFDYKPGLAERYDQDLPESVRKGQRITGMTASQNRLPIVPSAFPFAQAGKSGAWVSSLLPWTSKIVDDITIVRSLHTDQINHDPAMLAMANGTAFPGKPAVGAWLSYGLGSMNEDLPTFVTMTSSFRTTGFVQALSGAIWSAGFLPARHSGVPVRGVGEPVLYLPNPPGVTSVTRRKMLDAVRGMNELHTEAVRDPAVAERTAQYEQAFRLQSAVPNLTDLSGESEATFALYGPDAHTPGTFAANCLLARRMIERGVRFVDLFHRGWDSHMFLPREHSSQCQDVDQACHGLITDLKQRGLLEDTLVIWSGEFGRTVYCQGALSKSDYGRDHHGNCFSIWMAGGGTKPGLVYGETDDFSYNVVGDPVHVRDFHATLLHLFGLDPETLKYPHLGLDERLIGVDDPANVVTGILA